MIVRIKAFIIDKLFWFHEALATYHSKMVAHHLKKQAAEVEIMKYYNNTYAEITRVNEEG